MTSAAGLVLEADRHGVRLLTLNRPHALNAFDQRLYDTFTDALVRADGDDSVSVIVTTGAGRAFSAGTDLKDLAAHGDFRRGPDTRHGFEGLMAALLELRKPLVCAVNGLAVGLGATLLGHADLVFMAESAQVRCPFTALGLAPEAASSVTFPRLMGRQHAAWVLMSSAWLDASTCVTAGLAFQTVPDKSLLTVALQHANEIALQPVASLVATKQLIKASANAETRRALDHESAAFDHLLQSRAHREALRAFHEPPAPEPAVLNMAARPA